MHIYIRRLSILTHSSSTLYERQIYLNNSTKHCGPSKLMLASTTLPFSSHCDRHYVLLLLLPQVLLYN